MNTLIVCRKELNSYFRSPIAYGLMAFFALISGYFFYVAVMFFVRRGLQEAMMGQSAPMDMNDMVIRPLLSNMSVIGLLMIPLITMRLFAEEKRTGTVELLLTSPLTDLEIILGKWLAAFVLYASMLGLSLLSVALLFAYGKPDWRPMMVGYLGLLLQGGAFLAIGMFVSACTKNQIVAAAGAFAINLLLWVLDWVTQFEPTTTSRILGYISILGHSESFGKGVLDSKDFIYFASAIFFGIFLTARAMESLRWRA
jgi:ABC-2 type transport system permease protein